MPVNAFVYVIESPSALDLLDGRTEGRLLCEALQLAGIPHWYSLAASRATFVEALDARLKQAWDQFRVPPILHLSVHGNERGVALTDGAFIPWYELRQMLRPLNQWMNGWLLITMSACYGSNGCVMAMHSEDEPTFWALVGNTGVATWSDAAVAFTTFFHNFYKGNGLDDCVERMKVASGDNNFVGVFGLNAKQHWVNQLAAQQAPVPPPAPALQSPQ